MSIFKISFAVLFLLSSQTALAFSFSPIMSIFAPSGDDSTQTFTAENQSDEKVALQVTAFTRSIDENGKETLTPCSDFKIFPEQFSLGAKSSRAVRITYKGPTAVPKERAYRIIAEELPVDLVPPKKQKAKGQMKFLVRYATAIYVRGPDAEPKIKIEAHKVVSGKDEKLSLTILNEGTAHQLLFPAHLDLHSKNGAVALSGNKLESFDKQNLLAGTKRIFVLPWPPELKSGSKSEPIEAKIQFQ
jgi:fimbrial chaperone protein